MDQLDYSFIIHHYMKTNLYDEIPYTKHIYQQTQPNQLATLATFFGLKPPPVEKCRVLELGCASGINTIAMAQAIPYGEFVGIEFSEQIKEGQNNIRQLGLSNISLKKMDILDFDAELGLFDYIVAHGVYSWVSPTVRDKVLQICSRHLQPNGIAYVSYNVYPGWHVDRMLRDMMLYHTRKIAAPKEKLESAKKLLDFFMESIKHKFDSYSLSLRKELHHISQFNENYLAHEYLEEYNAPVLFHEFIEHANRHGLQYLVDMRTPFIAAENFLSETVDTLNFSIIEKEQYLDFLRNTAFRETLLCHQAISINRHLVTDRISDFYIAAPLKPASHNQTQQEPLQHDMAERFENLAGEAVLSVSSPLLKALCLCLGEVWPQSLSFNHLMQQVTKLLTMVEKRGKEQGERGKENAQTVLSPAEMDEVKTMLLEFYLKKIVELSVYPPRFTVTLNERPIASPIARLQSTQGKQVTNLRYEVFSLDLSTRLVLRHLDGTSDRVALLGILRQHLENGELILYQDEQKKTLSQVDSETLEHHLFLKLEAILQSLAQKAYLVM